VPLEIVLAGEINFNRNITSIFGEDRLENNHY